MKKISIIVPVYNTEKYLKRCLDSIIAQNFQDIEIIVINDCSLDNSLNIIKEYMKKDRRIILIDKRVNEGLSAARNSGIKIAKGEYILHIDSDDWIEPNYFRDMYTIAKEKQADIVISDYYVDFDEGTIIHKRIANNIKYLNNEEVIEKIFLCKLIPAVWNKMIKTNLYKENNIIHPEGITIGEDLAVISKLIYYSSKIVIKNKAYYHYIQNINSVTKKREKSNKKLYDIYAVINMLDTFFKEKGDKFLLNEMKINYLSGWLLHCENIKEDKYKRIKNDYISWFKKIDINKLSSKKIKILAYFIKIFKINK